MTNNKIGVIILLVVAIMAIAFLNNEGGTFSILGSPSLMHTIDYTDMDEEEWMAPPPMLFGSDEFTTSPMDYDFEVCGRNRTFAPLPFARCWTTDSSFQGRVFDLELGVPTPINDYFMVSLATSALIDDPDARHDDFWLDPGRNVYSFELYNDDFLEAKIVPRDTILLLNEEAQLEVEIRNDLANDLPGGLIITTVSFIDNKVSQIKEIEFNLSKGTVKYLIDINTSELNKMTIKVRPFVEIMGVRFSEDRVSERTFNVVPFIDTSAFSVDCTNTPCGEGFRCENVIQDNKEFNLCLKGESTVITDFDLRDLDVTLIIGLLILFAVLVYLAQRRQ
jgi:hypothetical protein